MKMKNKQEEKDKSEKLYGKESEKRETEIRRVDVIPATKRTIQAGGQLRVSQKLRVAAYCRVSTGDESQQTSYTRQKEFYTRFIQQKEGWTIAGVYADEAISGTSRSKRSQFNKMMEDSLNGKIDYIVTKSISRFARNTIDTLDCVRQLRQQNPPVGIYFEKENIDTLDAKGELILTILSALAQDESRSLSDNIRWSFQKKFREGIPQINLNRMLGYDKSEDGDWIVNENQAETVHYIFSHYLDGDSANAIAKKLNTEGRYTLSGNKWSSSTVLVVLRNEKYVGDLAMQKTITKNFLTHRSSPNRGEAPMYYVKNHHKGIISREEWEHVQILLQRKKMKKSGEEHSEKKHKRCPNRSSFDNLICGYCGGQMKRIGCTAYVSHYTDADNLIEEKSDNGTDKKTDKKKATFSYSVYRCQEKYAEQVRKNGRYTDAERKTMNKRCPCSNIYEDALEQSFMETLYMVRKDYMERGDKSDLVKLFQSAYQKEKHREKTTSYAWERLDLLNAQIQEMEEEAQSSPGLNQHLAKLLEEKRQLEEGQGHAFQMQKLFSLFVKCLEGLPEVNQAGMRLNVNQSGKSQKDEKKQSVKSEEKDATKITETIEETEAIEATGITEKIKEIKETKEIKEFKGTKEIKGFKGTKGTKKIKEIKEVKEIRGREEQDCAVQSQKQTNENKIEYAPDYLKFSKSIYEAFIIGGEVKNDTVVYKTSFGIPLVSIGNARRLSSFLGYRKCLKDGSLMIIRETYQVGERKIHYKNQEEQ